jgi:hypothetical protein
MSASKNRGCENHNCACNPSASASSQKITRAKIASKYVVNKDFASGITKSRQAT